LLKSVYEIRSPNPLAVLRSYRNFFNPVDLCSGSVGGPVKVIFEGRLGSPKLEDSGTACVPEFWEDSMRDVGILVNIQSYDINCQHKEIAKFTNKRIRVTVETI